MAQLLKQISYPPLGSGEYSAKLVKYSQKSATEYVRLEWQLESGRLIVDNRWATGLSIAISQLRTQLELGDDVLEYSEVLELAKTNVVLLYVSYNTVGGKSYRNINFVPPVTVEEHPDVVYLDEDDITL